jgi:hypothetical protein
MLVIGGGVIGLEMGSVWSRLGAEVRKRHHRFTGHASALLSPLLSVTDQTPWGGAAFL